MVSVMRIPAEQLQGTRWQLGRPMLHASLRRVLAAGWHKAGCHRACNPACLTGLLSAAGVMGRLAGSCCVPVWLQFAQLDRHLLLHK